MIQALFETVQARATQSGEFWMVYTGAGWNAGGGCQRPQQLAEAAAASGAAVVHLAPGNACLVRREGVIVRSAREWKRFAEIEAERRYAMLVYPDANSRDMAQQLDGWTRIYDCVDDWEEFASRTYFAGQMEAERELLSACEVVTATARTLIDKHAQPREAAGRAPIAYLPNSTMMADLPWSGGPRNVDCVAVGWWGDVWIEWSYVEALLEAGLSVRLIGPPERKRPLQHERLEWTGLLPWRQVMGPLSEGRVGIVPFADIPLTHAVDPIKHYDYLAAGLPTVATHLPELEGRPYATVAHDAESFVAAVRAQLADEPDRHAVRRFAGRHTHIARFAELREIIAAHERRDTEAQADDDDDLAAGTGPGAEDRAGAVLRGGLSADGDLLPAPLGELDMLIASGEGSRHRAGLGDDDDLAGGAGLDR